MSGSAGGHRISRASVEATVKDYINRVLSKYPGFKSAKVSGSYNYSNKQDFGDLDLIVFIEGEDKKQVKNALADYLSSLPDDIIVPFKSEKYAGKKLLKPGELVTVLYPVSGVPGEFVQIDNIVAITQQEDNFKQMFLDVPASTQGLILGLVKAATVEVDPKRLFNKLGIKDVPSLEQNQEYEFNLSADKLTLRIVTLDNFKEVARQVVWTSQNWSDVEKLLSNYNLNTSFEDLLQQVKRGVKTERGKNRIKGIFKSMVTVKSGEVGTPKGDDKEKALQQVSTLEGKYSPLTLTLIEGLLPETISPQAIAVFPGAFKPPHKSHFEVVKTVAPKVDEVKVYVSKQPRGGEDGQPTITQEQSLKIWNIYKHYLPDNVQIIPAKNPTPVLDAYQEIESHPDNHYLAIFGKGDESRWKAIEKNPTKYGHVQTVNLGDIEGVSATKLRTALSQGDDQQVIQYLPTMNQQDTQQVLDILKGK